MHDGENSVMVIFTVSMSVVLHCLNKFGETALIIASGNGHLETAKLYTPTAKCFGQLSEKGECCSMWTVHMVCQATVQCVQCMMDRIQS